MDCYWCNLFIKIPTNLLGAFSLLFELINIWLYSKSSLSECGQLSAHACVLAYMHRYICVYVCVVISNSLFTLFHFHKHAHMYMKSMY